MDRLQIAIQKARAQRAEKLHSDAAADAAPTADANGRPAPVVAPIRTAWERLAPFDRDNRTLRQNRLIATEGGREAAPYDLLRTRMLHQARGNGWRRIGIVSPTTGCGKTTTVANLAFSLSRQPDLRALVLDLDLRRPRLAQMLGQRIGSSMEDVLRGKVDFADHGLRLERNVALGLNSKAASSPSELLQSRTAMERLAATEAAFAPDIVLVDLPPMMATDDNFGFLGNVDAVLVMIAAEQSTMTEIEVTLRQISDLTQVLGLVLNKCRYTHGAYGYDTKYY